MPTAPAPVDLLVVGASEIATGRGSTPLAGPRLRELEVITHGAIAVKGDRIVALGDEQDLRAAFLPAATLDAKGGTIVPGFVDAHTHPVFAATREDEFELRTQGKTYLEIAAAGGGILSSVRSLRAAGPEELLERVLLRLARFLALGTTTIEAKSGYGLSLADERKSLEVLAEANRRQPVECVPTFLGAHEVPPEFRGRRSDYVSHLCAEMLPEISERGLAEYCDVFLEAHTFDVADTRRLFARARELGYGLRLHADQLSACGGAELAAEFGVASADHLEHVQDAGIQALARAGVVPVLCPVVPLYLRQEREAPGRRMIDAGLAPAVATDFNPGSCFLQSLPEAMSFAALRYRMSAAECLNAATLNAACSLGRGHEIGTLEPGKRADLLVLDVPNHRHLVYELGRNPVRTVIARGRVVHERDPRASA